MFFGKKEKPKEIPKEEPKKKSIPHMILVSVEELGCFATTSPTAEGMVKFCGVLDNIGLLDTPDGEYRAVGILYRKKKQT